ncbi:MAG: aldose epimerase family protein [Oscillospiraceae bacterium]
MTQIIKTNGKIDFISIRNEYIKAVVSNIGCAIVSLKTKNKDGIFTDNVLGFDKIDTYITQDKYIGVFVGRCANRIENGSFFLNDEEHKLFVNNTPNHLHGGKEGFDKKIFDYISTDDSIEFSYISKDNEEGYPGELTVRVKYQLQGNKFVITYDAISSKDTIFNPTNHTYFNLSDGKSDILEHYLQISSDKFGIINSNSLATGQLANVFNTPFDFTVPKKIGKDIYADDAQIILANGYDHSFVLNKSSNQITLSDVASGKSLTVSTTMPCVQLYTANFLDGNIKGKNNKFYAKHDGVCLETQFFPNAINNNFKNDVILKANKPFSQSTIWEFN